MTCLVDTFHILEDVMSVGIDHSHSKVVIIGMRVLYISFVRDSRGIECVKHTEYEFSPSSDEPVARMLGE